MVTRKTAPVGTAIRLVPLISPDNIGSYRRDYIDKIGRVEEWSNSNCIYVIFDDNIPSTWFLPADAELYTPNHCGDALDRIRG